MRLLMFMPKDLQQSSSKRRSVVAVCWHSRWQGKNCLEVFGKNQLKSTKSVFIAQKIMWMLITSQVSIYRYAIAWPLCATARIHLFLNIVNIITVADISQALVIGHCRICEVLHKKGKQKKRSSTCLLASVVWSSGHKINTAKCLQQVNSFSDVNFIGPRTRKTGMSLDTLSVLLRKV